MKFRPCDATKTGEIRPFIIFRYFLSHLVEVAYLYGVLL